MRHWSRCRSCCCGFGSCTLHPPGGPPAVLHDVHVLPAVRSIAHSEDSVIEGSLGALGLVVHATLVHLEALVGGIDGDRDGPDHCYRLSQSLLVLALDVGVAGAGGADVALLEAAALFAGEGRRDSWPRCRSPSSRRTRRRSP